MADGISLFSPAGLSGASPVSGLWIAPGVVSGQVSPTQNRLQYVPFVAQRAFTIADVRASCTTAAAANVYRNGVYLDSGLGYPGALLADWGTMDFAATGVKTIASLTTAAPGRAIIWLAGVLQGGTGAAADQLSVRHFEYLVSYSSTFGNASRGYFEDSVTGALPATAFAGSAPTVSNQLASNPVAQRLLVT